MKHGTPTVFVVCSLYGLLLWGCSAERIAAKPNAASAPSCSQPATGCACEAGSPPIPCFGPDQVQADGTILCTEGTRSCREGRYSACEEQRSYVADVEPELAALVDPGAAPRNCSMCDVKCFSITDPLLGIPGDGGVVNAGDGGLQLPPGPGAPGDAGPQMLSECELLDQCCTDLTGSDAVRNACRDAVAEDDPALCESVLPFYCPSVITGPPDDCVIGASEIDSDCDGIPDVLDDCTATSALTNPDCNGSVLPLPSTNNQTLFHVLHQGESGSNALEVAFQVKNADVYFLMDMSDTMAEERDRLVSTLISGNVVECALLENCCDRLSGSMKSACQGVVRNDVQSACLSAESTYCGSSPEATHCADLDFDGFPDDQLKGQGVVGALRCLLGNSWFGAGTFIELPFRDGVFYTTTGAMDSSGFRDRGNSDENTFKHVVDMTRDMLEVQNAIGRFRTNRNYEYPEAQVVALYSLLTGKGQMFGNQSNSIPERDGLGCPADSFGYPCFREGAIPIVVLFTDDPLNNGPPVYSPRFGETDAVYDDTYVLNGKAPTSGQAQFTPKQAETFLTALNLGDITDQFVIASGNLRPMSGDYPDPVTGCAPEAAAPDAVYRFSLERDATVTFRVNTRKDSRGYDDSQGDGNDPSSATEAPVVVSVYDAVPASVQDPIDVGDTRVNPIPSGPDQTYLTYVGTTAGPASEHGLLGGISGCRADGMTNEVAYTFRPAVDARLVIDADQSSFDSVVSLHLGDPSALPANPSGSDRVVLEGPSQNLNDTFDTALRIGGGDGFIDGDYVTYVGDLAQLTDSGEDAVNTLEGASGLADYEAPLVGCTTSSGGSDAVFELRIGGATRLRIDTEGSMVNTVLSLHYANTDPLDPANALACDAESGPNGSAAIEADLEPGTYYVVVKGESGGQAGAYQLNVRDTTARPEQRLACASSAGGDRLEYDVVAGTTYTVLLKGAARFQQGAYSLKLYDPTGLASSGAALLQCRLVCPNVAPYSVTGPLRCSNSERTNTSFDVALSAGTHYVTVKSRNVQDAGFFELQIGDPADGSNATRYTPPKWSDLLAAVRDTGAKILPVISCPKGGNNGRCDGTERQTRALARASGAVDAAGAGLTRYINENGSGIGAGLASAVRDLANYLAMDITLDVVNNPGFTVRIQKCTQPGDAQQAGVCPGFSTGCADATPYPRNTIQDCTPGAVPKFVVEFTNPEAPNQVPPNAMDANGGYHFKLQIVGERRFLLEEIPVYIIPIDSMGPPPWNGGPGAFQPTGSYEQQVFGAGCTYYQLEGEGPGSVSCSDGMDNNGDGTRDQGMDANRDGDYDDPDEFAPDPGCLAGSCFDGETNDGDAQTDYEDLECTSNSTPDWSDLFFEADVPAGTSLEFALCTGSAPEELEDCDYSTFATVTSDGHRCDGDSDCRAREVGAGTLHGYCGAGGQCQFIDPPKLGGTCTSDAECVSGVGTSRPVASFCDAGRCRYVTPPGDVSGNLASGQNGKPFAKLRVTLNANADASLSPTLYDWELQYVCRDMR